MKPNYDTTLARIAGNIAAGLVANHEDMEPYVPNIHEELIAAHAVGLARAIVAEVQRTTVAENATENEVRPSCSTERT